VLLGVMVLGVRVVMDGRVRLRGDAVVVVALPPRWMHGHSWRYVSARHHGQWTWMLPSQSAPARDHATNLRGNAGRLREPSELCVRLHATARERRRWSEGVGGRGGPG
jgi:hypothetical protein